MYSLIATVLLSILLGIAIIFGVTGLAGIILSFSLSLVLGICAAFLCLYDEDN